MAKQALARRPVAKPDKQDLTPPRLVCRWRKDETGRLVCAWQVEPYQSRDDEPQLRGRVIALAGARKGVRHVVA